MSDTKRVERKEDMSPRGRLCVCIQAAAEFVVGGAEVEFLKVYHGPKCFALVPTQILAQ